MPSAARPVDLGKRGSMARGLFDVTPSNPLTLECRSCARRELRFVLSLGSTPLANSLLDEEHLATPEKTYPLELAFCESCTLLQITESVPPAEMFSTYLYFSSFSDTMVAHAAALASRLVTQCHLGPSSLVVEVASNDGYLLQHYLRAGVPVLGIEPAQNIAAVAREQRGIATISEFFDDQLAARLAGEGRRADVVHANNVLAHVPDLNGFVRGLHTIIKDDGMVVIEAPYATDFIERCEFDTIYHEHLCYFSLTALDALFTRHGLRIVDVERIPIHGGSLRIFARREGPRTVGQNVRDLLEEERAWGVRTFSRYEAFATRVRDLKEELRALLYDLKRQGKSIAAYGAAAKGATLLNYVGVGKDVLDYVVDRSTYKQGHFMPGIHLPIHGTERLLETKPDFVLILAWNFAEEIMAQQSEYRAGGGRFIVPVPVPRVLD